MPYRIGDYADAAAALEQAHERARLFEAIIESMGESVLVVDRHGREIYSNRELKRFRGQVGSEEGLDTWRAPSRIRIFDAERRELAPDQWPVVRALRGDHATNFEIFVEGMAHREGETLLSISTRSMVNAAGDSVGAVIVTRDITDGRRVELELRQSQKLEAVGQLTGGIAHDFNNLLTAILINAEVLVARLADRPDIAPLAQSLVVAAGRGAELTDHLLSFSRRQPIMPKSVDVGSLVEKMSAMLSRALGDEIDLRVLRQRELWSARVDPALLETAILNLSINARDAMKRGGPLVIDLSNCEIAGAGSSALPPGEYIRISVSDTGEGIAPADLNRVFEPFFTTKPVGKGTGLGLSMVYGFVKQSGGNVEMQSELGAGTSVIMYLPRSHDPVDAAASHASPIDQPGGSENVLLVEDNELVRQHVHHALVSLGYRVTCASNGPEALDILGADGVQFDLLFTDVRMPGGMTGVELAETARQIRPHLRGLLTTGFAPDHELTPARDPNSFALLRKPYSTSDLARALRKSLDETEDAGHA